MRPRSTHPQPFSYNLLTRLVEYKYLRFHINWSICIAWDNTLVSHDDQFDKYAAFSLGQTEKNAIASLRCWFTLWYFI